MAQGIRDGKSISGPALETAKKLNPEVGKAIIESSDIANPDITAAIKTFNASKQSPADFDTATKSIGDTIHKAPTLSK